MDIKELQYQFNRLQEENILLQEQMADVEESNVSLRSENSQLKSRINKWVIILFSHKNNLTHCSLSTIIYYRS